MPPKTASPVRQDTGTGQRALATCGCPIDRAPAGCRPELPLGTDAWSQIAAPPLQSRPQSGARPKSGAAAPPAGGGKKGAAGGPPPAAEELKQKAEQLERNLRNEELARNYMQLERVRRGGDSGSNSRGRRRLTGGWEAPAPPAACRLPPRVQNPAPYDNLAPRNVLLLSVLQDKIQAFWEISRRELGDRQVELRLKDRELEEAQVGAAWGETSGSACVWDCVTCRSCWKQTAPLPCTQSSRAAACHAPCVPPRLLPPASVRPAALPCLTATALLYLCTAGCTACRTATPWSSRCTSRR